jgi:hypothetical protein
MSGFPNREICTQWPLFDLRILRTIYVCRNKTSPSCKIRNESRWDWQVSSQQEKDNLFISLDFIGDTQRINLQLRKRIQSSLFQGENKNVAEVVNHHTHPFKCSGGIDMANLFERCSPFFRWKVSAIGRQICKETESIWLNSSKFLTNLNWTGLKLLTILYDFNKGQLGSKNGQTRGQRQSIGGSDSAQRSTARKSTRL